MIDAAEADDSKDVVNLITSELTFVIEETVLTQRRQRVKGPGTIKQQREALLFQTHKFQLPEIPNKFSKGSNLGDTFSDVGMPISGLEAWTTTLENKYKIYTTDNLARSSDDDTAPTRLEDEEEPVSWWQFAVKDYRDLLRGRRVKLVIDGTVSGGNLLEACLFENASYYGICMSETHKVMLEERTIKQVRVMMAVPGNLFHNVRYCADLAGSTQKVWSLQQRKRLQKRPPQKEEGSCKSSGGGTCRQESKTRRKQGCWGRRRRRQ